MPETESRRSQYIAICGGVVVVLAVASAAVLQWKQDKQLRAQKQEQEAQAYRKLFDSPELGAGGVSVRQVAGCNEELPWREKPRVQNVVRDGDSLVVTLLANNTCGPFKAASPSAVLQGKSLALDWSWRRVDDSPVAACICTRHLEFRVPKMPPGDITVTTLKTE
jgi:hypothetical protein